MKHCVNRKSKEFLDLQSKMNINPVVLAAKVSLWQETNGLDDFPSSEQIQAYNLAVEIIEGNKLYNEVQETLSDKQLVLLDEQIFKFEYDKLPLNILEQIKNIGTEEEYKNYLKTIFPESKLQKILWHGSPINIKEFKSTTDFTKEELKNEFSKGKGIYFSEDKYYWEHSKYRIPVILNVKNPRYSDGTYVHEGMIKELSENNQDSIIFTSEENLAKWNKLEKDLRDRGEIERADDIANKPKFKRAERIENYEVIVFNSNQIHILGDNSDIEAFKQWKKNNPTNDITNLTDNSKGELFQTTSESILQNTIEDEILNYSNINSKILFNDEQGKFTVDQILNNILINYNGLTSETKSLLEKASKLKGLSLSKIKFVSSKSFQHNDTLMEYDSNLNTINLSRDVLQYYSPEDIIQSFIHEVAHSTSVQAYLKPNTFEERDFRDLVDKMFFKYRDRALERDSEGNLSYGFTNQVEFIAELYSNQAFQLEIEGLEVGKNSLWKEFLDAIRRLFGLSKNNDYDNLIKQVVQVVETKQNEYKGLNNDSNHIFASKKEIIVKPPMQTLEDKLRDTLNIAKDNLDQLLKRSKSYAKKDAVKGQQFKKHIEELVEKLEEIESLNEWKGITIYLNSLSHTVGQLTRRLDNANLSGQEGLELIELYRSYLSSYNLLGDVRKLITDVRTKDLDTISKEEIINITNELKNITGSHAILEEKFNSVVKDIVKSELTDKKYASEVITKWRNKLAKEYNPNTTSLSKTEWIVNQLNTVHNEEINNDIESYVNELVEGIGNDISSFDKLLFSSVNNNSRLIQFFQKVISGVRTKIVEKTRSKDIEMKSLFDKFIKEKGNKKPSELYKNLLEFDSTGKAYLKGEYQVKFREEYIKVYNERNHALTKGRGSEEYRKADKALKTWLDKNTIKIDNEFIPAPKWKSDFSKLSETEKEVLKEFTNIIEITNKQTFGKNSLIRTSYGAKFYTLPAVTISSLERVLEGKVKGAIQDKWKDLTEIRPDDIGYKERLLTGKGDPLNAIRVHYRGDVLPNEQSLDLFTIMRLEFINGINFEEKQKKQLLLEGIVDIAKNKDYQLTQKGSGIPIVNKFAQRRPTATFRGIESNEYKRLKTLLDQSVYDIFHEDAGTIAGKDVNKLVNGVNSWAASLGMTLNYFNAPVNILNGEFQMLIERMGGNHIDKKSLAKAHSLYTKDMPNLMKDLGQPIKTSFVNQVNQLFDTFGGFTVDQKEYIKNTLTKSLVDPHSLQFMQEGGEHMLQSVFTMAVLNSIKVMNKDGQFINKKGEVVKEANAVSLLDMLETDSKGLVKVSDKVVYTDKNLTNEFNDGGRENVMLFLKKKIFDTMGEYDKNFQVELQRYWYGKLILMFKKYLIPLGIARFRGITTSLKEKEELLDRDLHYSDALQEYEEGIYTSTVRFIRRGIIPALKNLQYNILKQNWNELTDYEKANIRKTTTELVTTALLGMLITPLIVAAAEDGDDEYLWYLAMITRRLDSELSQYRDPRELYKVTKNPVASLNLINNVISFSEQVISPWNWNEEDREGNLKIVKAGKKLVPILNKVDTKSEDLYNFIDRKVGF